MMKRVLGQFCNHHLLKVQKYNIQRVKSAYPEFPKRIPISDKVDRVQDYETITASEYKAIFQSDMGKEEEKETIRQTAYFQLEREGKLYHVYDASKMKFGKILQPVVKILQGKHKPTYDRRVLNQDDIVIIVNASETHLSGRKMLYKEVVYHTGYPGSLKRVPYKFMIQHKPEQLFMWRVRNMLPKIKRRDDLLKNLYVYRDNAHDFMEIVPTFVKRAEKVDQTFNYDMFQEILDDKPKIIYSSHGREGIPKEFEHFEYDEKDDMGITKYKQTQLVKFSMSKTKVAKLKREYKRKLKRYRTYEYKWPKNRDPRLHDRPFLIDSDKMIEKYQLHDMIAPEEETDTDN